MSFQKHFVHQTFILAPSLRPGIETHRRRLEILVVKHLDFGVRQVWL